MPGASRRRAMGYNRRMSLASVVARPMIAGMFVFGGLDAFRNPSSKVPKASKVAPQIADTVGLPSDTEQLVRMNGAVQVGAGVALAMGFFPRLAAITLAGSLIPTTMAGHRFWEEDEAAARNQQIVQFLKNAAMFGGLLMIVEHG
jgi:putative oxidoreductase